MCENNLSWQSKRMITLVYHRANRINPAFGDKFFHMLMNGCESWQWQLYLSNEFLGLIRYDENLRNLTICAIETLKEFK